MEEEQIAFDPTEDMSEDDLAANLGFLTTLSEGTLPQEGPMGELQESMVEQEEGGVGRIASNDEKDIEQDEKIRQIEMELKALLNDDGEPTEGEEITEEASGA